MQCGVAVCFDSVLPKYLKLIEALLEQVTSSVFQCVPVCCSVLQCVIVCRSVL